MKRERTAITLIELLTVLAIIALLAGILIPTLSAVKNYAREAKQKAQFSTIELGLTAFKNDFYDYPPSDGRIPPPSFGMLDYCGAQKLAEALLGWDLLGFHPESAWRSDGLDKNGGDLSYDPDRNRVNPDGTFATFDERKGHYLELATTNAFRLGNISPDKPGLFRDTSLLHPDTFVICDVFGSINTALPGGKLVKAGAPILYYKADTSKKKIELIYDDYDNAVIVAIKEGADGKGHPLIDSSFFYEYIRDKKIDPTVRIWPYRPDSYILISAGADGIYGTGDDIRNFGY